MLEQVVPARVPSHCRAPLNSAVRRPNVRYLTSLFITLIAGAALSGTAPEVTPAQLAIVDAHLRQIGVVGHIPPEYVQMNAVSMPGEGQIALAVLYTHESPTGSGNNYDRRLAVFLRSGDGLSAPIDIIAGGAFRRSLILREVTPDTVVLDALNYASGDGGCCPSIPGVVTYRLSQGALVEPGSPSKSM